MPSLIGRFAVAALAVLLVAGCRTHIQGKWSLAQIDPDAARRDFEFTSLTLQDDGTFYGEASSDEGTRTTSGTYLYKVRENTLVLNTHDGRALTYDADVLRNGRELELIKFWKQQKVIARFEREE